MINTATGHFDWVKKLDVQCFDTVVQVTGRPSGLQKILHWQITQRRPWRVYLPGPTWSDRWGKTFQLNENQKSVVAPLENRTQCKCLSDDNLMETQDGLQSHTSPKHIHCKHSTLRWHTNIQKLLHTFKCIFSTQNVQNCKRTHRFQLETMRHQSADNVT